MSECGRHSSQVLIVQQFLKYALCEALRRTTHSGFGAQGNLLHRHLCAKLTDTLSK